MNLILRLLVSSALLWFPHQAWANAEATSIEVFVGGENTAHTGPHLTAPAGTDSLRFLVNPKSLFVRYKLEGLDEEWNQRTDTMFVRVVFFNRQGDQIRTDSFPVSGRSAGWKGSIKNSAFTLRQQTVTMPPDTGSMSLTMTTAGPASLVGIFAIKDMNVTTVAETRGALQVPDVG